MYATTLFSAEECAAVLAEARALDPWHDADITVEHSDGTADVVVDTSTRSARILDVTAGADILARFEAEVRRRILPLISEIWRADFDGIEGTQLVGYKPGGHYDTHQDSGQTFADRYFTVVCYLNDDFEGGHTSFPSLPYQAQPRTGKAVIFPSAYYHCAEPVTRGEKFVLITWICGPVPVQWI